MSKCYLPDCTEEAIPGVKYCPRDCIGRPLEDLYTKDQIKRLDSEFGIGITRIPDGEDR